MLRRTIFWIHLAVGLTCGLVILMMSVTGVLLTYERQILAFGERAMYHSPTSTTAALPQPAEALLDRVRAADPGFAPTTYAITSDALAPAILSAGRSGRRYVDRYTGEILDDSAAGTRAFFDTITAWHRWFDASDEHRATARTITGASNLAFLFLLLSGTYLWLPPVFNRFAFRVRFLFNPKADNSKARDYNWHHVFGIWSVVPLIVIVATATVFNYEWANTLLYRAVGDAPPERGPAPPGAAQAARRQVPPASPEVPERPQAALDAVLAAADQASPDWVSLTLTLPGPGDTDVRVAVDHGNGGQPQRRSTLVLDRQTAAVLQNEPFSDLAPGRRARSWVRFLHTGEALGLAGQTVAGLVSLASVVMVWTGVALAWRRLVSPLLRRRRLATEA